MKVSRAGLAALITAVCLSACGSGPAAPDDKFPETTAEMADFLHQTVSFDYDPYPNPEAMREGSAFAGVGRVKSVTEAMIAEDAGGDTGAIVVGLAIEETWKHDPDLKDASVVHFVLHRPTNVGVDVYKRALQEGTRIALFGDKPTVRLSEGDPEDVVYEPSPQGLIIEESTKEAHNVWGSIENSELPGWTNAESISGLRSKLDLS